MLLTLMVDNPEEYIPVKRKHLISNKFLILQVSKTCIMSKHPKTSGNAGFVIGLIVYIIVGLFFFLVAAGAFTAAAHETIEYEGTVFLSIGGVATTLFIAVSLWFISFSVAYQQRKVQITLLDELTKANL